MEEMKQPLEQEIASELTEQVQEAELPQEAPEIEVPEVEAPAPEAPVVPKKAKKNVGVTIGIICAAAILCGSIAWAAVTAKKSLDKTMELLNNQPQTNTDVSAEPAVDPSTGEVSHVDADELKEHSGYTYSDESLTEKYNSLIVAKVGDEELNGAMFQIFYWANVYNYLNSNQDYIAYLGPDITQPLSEQNYGEDTTWEQFFVESALEMYLQFIAMYNDAVDAGTQLSEAAQASADNIEENMAEEALSKGFESVDAYLEYNFGPGITINEYKEYNRLSSLAFARAAELQSSISLTDEEIEAFFDANADAYTQQGIQKVDKPVVNVRHILIQPEKDIDSDPSDENLEPDTSSDEAWAAAEKSANEIYENWKQNPTEDNFAVKATESTMDSGSMESGGLYENVYPGQMVTEFNDWCFADGRKVGDNGIVKTTYGYHIMYFSGVGEDIYWRAQAKVDATSQKFNEMLDEIFSRYSLDANYDNIHIYDILAVQQELFAQSEEESVTE